MRAPDLEHPMEFLRLGLQAVAQCFEGGHEVFLQGHPGGNMHCGREGVVGGLPLIDMIVGVDRLFVPADVDCHPGKLCTAVGDHLVGVHVG